jgi:hypothetical protein
MLMPYPTSRTEETSEDMSRCVLGKFVVMEELAVGHEHTRKERQFKQGLKKGTLGPTMVKAFFVARG